MLKYNSLYKKGEAMQEQTASNAHDINGQDRLKARLQEQILQLSEINRACLLGIELTLFFEQNSKSCSGGLEGK
jgi:hypothetical protein